MIKANIHQAKARLSELVEAAAAGERVVICKHNRPVAELRTVADTARTAPRPLTAPSVPFDVPATFFDAMPDDFLNAIDGGARPPTDAPLATHAAEPPAPPYGGRRRSRSRR
jgi:prevent-host-death family protein